MAKRKRKPVVAVQLVLFGALDQRRGDHASPLIEVVTRQFEGIDVRIVLVNGVEWFVLSDVAKALGYRDAPNASRCLKPKHLSTQKVSASAGSRVVDVISESGLNRLMLRSRRKEAERFQDWIEEDVIPSIRRTGSYSLPSAGSLVAKFQKRLNSDIGTAKERVDSLHLNKGMHGSLAAEGANPRDFQDIHNAWYLEIAGIKAPELRKLLGQRYWETPLDRLSQIVLSQRNHAVAMLEKQVADMAESGVVLTMDQRKELFRGIIRKFKMHDLEHLGANFGYGVIEHDRRGKIVDIVRRQVESN